MKKTALIASVLGGLVMSLAGVSAASASYVATPGAIFNDPHGVHYPARNIENRIEADIANAPKGSTIRIATLGIGVQTAVNALIAAHKRGVVVRIVLPVSTKNGTYTTQLTKAIGTNWQAGKSYVAFCTTACYTSTPLSSTMHAKIYMFSQTGSSHDVSVLSSANLTQGAVTNNWNDAYTFVNSTAAYDVLRGYYDSLRFDKPKKFTNKHKINPSTALFLFPAAHFTKATDVWTTSLSPVHCTGARSAGSIGGRTVIRMATSLWETNRMDIVNRLGALRAAGCNVEVLVQSDKTDPDVLAALLKLHVPTRYSDGRDASRPNNHSKYIIVSGHVGANPNRDLVTTGSMNLTGLTSAESDNVVMRQSSVPLFAKYAASFVPIWGQSDTLTQNVVAERRAEVAAAR